MSLLDAAGPLSRGIDSGYEEAWLECLGIAEVIHFTYIGRGGLSRVDADTQGGSWIDDANSVLGYLVATLHT